METKKSYETAKGLITNAILPQETRTYKPITHQQLIDLTLESIESAGFQLQSESYSAARDGNVANGKYTIRNVADSEMQLQIGWQNSYDKTLSLKFAIGAQIFICQNGAVHGDMGAFKKAHKGVIQEFAPKTITEYIKQAGDVFQKMQSEREAMKQIEISTRVKAELIGRMVIEHQFIQSTQLNIIEKELKAPTHDYNAKDSLWELYNFTTFAMKEIHPSLWMQNHQKAHSFFVNESGLLVSNDTITIPVSVEPETPFTQLQMF
jgi:hypothetical protein